MLSKGGLHHDAAILYLNPLDDPLAAAREFEAAGEIDRALELYHQRSDHLAAGDLLRRVGDEAQALEEYQRAAEKMLAAGRSRYDAGELLRTHAGRLDLAVPHYEMGWAMRADGGQVPCAIRLAQAYTNSGETARLRLLADEAVEHLEPPGYVAEAGEFFNELARLADQHRHPQVRDDLRDLALLGIARKLRQRAEGGKVLADLASTMLGASQAWPPAVVSDARFALLQAGKRPRDTSPLPANITRVIINARIQSVSAVCQAAHSGDLFLGFESGEVVCFRPRLGEVSTVITVPNAIRSLAATDDGDAVVVHTTDFAGRTLLRSAVRSPTFAEAGLWGLPNDGAVELCRGLVGNRHSFRVGVWGELQLQVLGGPTFIPLTRIEFSEDGTEPTAVFLIPDSSSGIGVGAGTVPGRIHLLGACEHRRPCQPVERRRLERLCVEGRQPLSRRGKLA